MVEPDRAAAIAPATGRTSSRLRALAARDPLLTAAFVTLWVCSLVPLWAPRFLPLLDLPNHIDSIAIWHRYSDPSWGYSKYYDLNLLPLPYWGYFFPVHLLSYLLPIEIANKVYLSAYALALPVAVAMLATQLGRSRWLALFSFPLVFNINFSLGFITFCAGVVMMTFAFVILDRFLQAPTRKRAAALAAVTLGLYSTHVLPWMFFGLASFALALCHGWRPRRIAAALALELPSLIVGVIAYRAAAGHSAVGTGLSYDAKAGNILSALQQMPLLVLTAYAGSGTWIVLLALALAWLALLLTARADRAEPPAGDIAFTYRLELLFALAIAAYLFLPAHLLKPFDWWMIGGRFLAVAALFGALLIPGVIAGRRRWLLLPVFLVAVYHPLALARHWLLFDRRAASFRRLARQLERGSSTLTLVEGGGADPAVDPQAAPYLQFHSYAQYLAGGYDPYANDSGFPFRRKPDTKIPAPRWKHPDTFNFDSHAIYYDYILTMAEWSDYSYFGPDDAARAPLVARDGEWRLYKVRH
jgi:hypothetical protein